ncbi:hypothetical protein F0562_019650 [Nyssa sinensis]|uniref:Uncharacterized protein n=1 Tax=Nyssa sinensis TaxID=561372 RepID=A0A5J5BPQ8_9ASTE|nr:hypothetical protein F0562_019650 [Nyssa sinensis]
MIRSGGGGSGIDNEEKKSGGGWWEWGRDGRNGSVSSLLCANVELCIALSLSSTQLVISSLDTSSHISVGLKHLCLNQ